MNTIIQFSKFPLLNNLKCETLSYHSTVVSEASSTVINVKSLPSVTAIIALNSHIQS